MCQRFNMKPSKLETMPSISNPTLYICGVSPPKAWKTMAYILLLQEIADRALRREQMFQDLWIFLQKAMSSSLDSLGSHELFLWISATIWSQHFGATHIGPILSPHMCRYYRPSAFWPLDHFNGRENSRNVFSIYCRTERLWDLHYWPNSIISVGCQNVELFET